MIRYLLFVTLFFVVLTLVLGGCAPKREHPPIALKEWEYVAAGLWTVCIGSNRVFGYYQESVAAIRDESCGRSN